MCVPKHSTRRKAPATNFRKGGSIGVVPKSRGPLEGVYRVVQDLGCPKMRVPSHTKVNRSILVWGLIGVTLF